MVVGTVVNILVVNILLLNILCWRMILVPVMLIFGGMLNCLQKDTPLEPLLKALSRGFELGLAAKCVISYKLEDNWERPLSEWRQELNINIINNK